MAVNAKMKKHNAAYWKKRFQALENSQYQKTVAYYKDVQEQFRRATNDIQMDIEKWYRRLADNNEISLAAAKKLLKRSELEEFHWTVEEYIKYGEENVLNARWMKQLENASAKVHISRLEAMKLQMQQHAELLFTEYEGGITDFLYNSFEENYYHTAFELAKGTEIGTNLHKIDTRKIDTIIKQPWAADGSNFSERIWKNKEYLVNNLYTELTQNIIRGATPQQAIDNLANQMNVSKRQAGKLLMTESAAISAAADYQCYRELGIEKYEILATLDNLTSKICQEMDGKVFELKDYEIGLTAPPFHPNCRSTTIPYFEDEFTKEEERAARDKETSITYYVPASMKYKEWEKKYIDKEEKAVQSSLFNKNQEVFYIETELINDEKYDIIIEDKISDIIDSFPDINTITVRTDSLREMFAKMVINKLGIKAKNVEINIIPMEGIRGACDYYIQSSQKKCNYRAYNLQQQDIRSKEYKIKTIFHEAFHLSLQGHRWDAVKKGKINEKWRVIEETFAESAAMYAIKLYGIQKKLSPSYPELLIQTLPRMKQLFELEGCIGIEEIGKIAWKQRIFWKRGKWEKLYDKVYSISFDETKYYLQYLQFIKQNKKMLLDKFMDNRPEMSKYKEIYERKLNITLKKIENGKQIGEWLGKEDNVFINILAIAMIEEGIK